jgi:hypothetical protein
MAFSLALLGASAYEAPFSSSYDLLETEILAANQTSVTFSNLNNYAADYQHLQIRATVRDNRNVQYNLQETYMQINGVTSSIYRAHRLQGEGSSVISDDIGSATSMFVIRGSSSNAPANVFGAGVIDILDAFNSNKNTTIRSFGGNYTTNNNLGDRQVVQLLSGLFNSTAAVSSLSLFPASASFVAGSRFSLYGLKAA